MAGTHGSAGRGGHRRDAVDAPLAASGHAPRDGVFLPDAGKVERAAARVRVRRAMLLIVMTLLLPGSAQVLAGSKVVGRAALRVLALVAVTALVVWFKYGRNGVIAWSVHPEVLTTVQVGLIVLGLCWAALLIDAARLGGPGGLPPGQRVVCVGLVAVLMASVGTPLAYAVVLAGEQRNLVNSIFAPGGVADTYKGRLNVAILGGDGGLDRAGIRTDQNAVASIDVHTGRALLIGIPRNMRYAQFPPGTTMAKKFPNGFPDYFYGIYTYGAMHPELFPGVGNPGAAATEQAMAQILGIPIHYYVTLNLQGFESLIDSLGGLTIRVEQRLPIGGGHQTGACDLPGGGCRVGRANPIYGYIEPGLQKLNGYRALWYARSRATTTDYDRMSRERCVLNGILKQMDPITVLRHYKSLVSSAKNVVKTDLTQGALDVLVKVAAQTKKSQVTDLQLQPPLIIPALPDLSVIREHVQEAIAASNAPARPAPTAAPVRATATPTATPAGKHGKKAKNPPKATPAPPAPVVGPGETVNLDSVCRYS